MEMEDGEIKEALTVQSVCVCVRTCVHAHTQIGRVCEKKEREIMLEAKGGNVCMKLRGEKKREIGSVSRSPAYCFNIILLYIFITALFSPSKFSCFNYLDTDVYVNGREGGTLFLKNLSLFITLM